MLDWGTVGVLGRSGAEPFPFFEVTCPQDCYRNDLSSACRLVVSGP